MNAKWEIEEAFCLSTADQTIESLKGKYFIAYNAAGTKYAIWFDDNVVADPVVPGSPTLVPIAIAAATTPALLATATANAITAFAALNFTATVSDTTDVTAVYDDTSIVQGVEQGDAGSLINLVRAQIGGSIDLGLLDGDVTFDPVIESQDITAHQTGLTLLGKTVTSVGGTVSLTLKEYSAAKYRQIFEAVGGSVATTSVTGFGTALVSTNLLLKAKRLVLHPVYKSANDLTEDYTFWKSIPELGAITFSGENPNTLPLEFSSFQDDTKDSQINIWAFGDIGTLP
jgi:hypothetical protein